VTTTEAETGAGRHTAELRRGWKVVLAAMVGVGFGSTGLPFYTIGLFVRPLGQAFGWTRAEVSASALCLHAGMIVSAPIVGRLADRFGARKVGLASLIGLAIGFAGLTQISKPLLSLYIGWLALSLLASGTTPMVWTRATNGWFDKRRGLALGLTLVGTGLAAVLGPITVGHVIASSGWRAGFLTLAAATALIAWPVVFALFREAPPEVQAERSLGIASLTMRQAVRTSRFWRSGIGFFLISSGVASLIVHLTPFLVDHGSTAVQAAHLAGMLGLAIIFGRIIVGLLVDRFHAPFVALVFLSLSALAALCLAAGIIGPAIALLGLAAGAEVDLLAYLTSRYYGLKAYGEIYGWQLSFFSLGAGVGPILMGAAHDRLGDYQTGLYVVASLILAGALLIGSLGRFPDVVRPAEQA
jgi:MFS family permease